MSDELYPRYEMPSLLQHVPNDTTSSGPSELAEPICCAVPVHELEHLAKTWRDHARQYPGQGMGIALESCAVDIARLVNSYLHNVELSDRRANNP